MSTQLKSIFTVSLGTLGSRVFGLLRDVAMAAYLGISAASNAFIFAFTVPNLFRRLLGEGALTSAFIPVLARIVGEGDDGESHRFINRVLTRLLGVTVVLALALGLVFAAALVVLARSEAFPTFEAQMREQWQMGSLFALLLLPYLPMVCLAAILSAALNVKGHFAVPAVSPLLLNLCMICALLGGGLAGGLEAGQLALLLCAGVLLGGVLQLLSPAWALYRYGWRPRLDFTGTEHIRLLWTLFLPGVLGAAALQINVFVSRLLAFGLNETATTTLNYVNRLVELPLGLFAVAIATVIFPQMSVHLAQGREDDYRHAFNRGLRLMLAVTLPATVGLIVLAEPILTLLFRWGRFSAADVALLVPLLVITSLSIPFYAVSSFMTRACHARQDTRTPARIAVVVLVVNLGLSLLLMERFEAAGLAAANVTAALVQVLLLALSLRRHNRGQSFSPLWKALLQFSVASLLMAAAILLASHNLALLIADARLLALVNCVALVPLGGLLYFGILWMMGFEDRREIVALLLRRKRTPRQR